MSKEKVEDSEQTSSPAPNPPINNLQINYAKELIELKHPLRRIHITHVWPFLKIFSCCIGKPKRNFNLALKNSLRQKLGITMPKSDTKLEQNPFLRMGYGMNAYFDLIINLMKMMGFISVVAAMPAMVIYDSYSSLTPYVMFDNFMLGNMGGASFVCA